MTRASSRLIPGLTALILGACGTDPNGTIIATPDTLKYSGFTGAPSPIGLVLSSSKGTTSWTASPGVPWLSLSAAAGATMPATLTVTANASGKHGGLVTGTIAVTAPGHTTLALPVVMDIQTMNGTWHGAVGTQVFNLVLTEAAGVIAGNGTITDPTTTLVVSVTGTHNHPTILLVLNAPGFQSASATGAFAGPGALSTTITGSGFNGETLPLVRQ